MPGSSSAQITRTQGLAAICAHGCALVALAIPAFNLYAWGTASPEGLVLQHKLPDNLALFLPDGLHPGQRLAGALVYLTPALLNSCAYLSARRSLTAFARGDVFAPDVAEGLRGYAAFGFWAAIASLVATPAGTLAITLANAPGHRAISAGVSSMQILGILGAGVIWVIASAMARASAAARENAQFV